MVDLLNHFWTNVLFSSFEKWIVLYYFCLIELKTNKRKRPNLYWRNFHLLKEKKRMAFFLAQLDRKVGFNLKWLMRFCQAPWLYHHCSLSVQQPGEPGRHSVAQNHSPGKKLTGRSSARYTSMALSPGYRQFKCLNQKYVNFGDTHT